MQHHGLTKNPWTTVFGLALGLVAGACDLPQKDIGNETDGNGDTAGDTGGTCQPGDTKPAGDGCNTCECTDNGLWACTQIGCQPTGGSGSASGGGSTGGECTPGDTKPADDGCNTCQCTEDGQWACTLLGCPGTGTTGGSGWMGNDALEICPPDVPTDAVDILDATVQGDALVVDVGYSGGCETHYLGACWNGSFLESNPVQIQTFIAHEANGDTCEAYPQQQLTFDLAGLADAYADAYQTTTGTILINLEGWMDQLQYDF